jgi:hypothetical protein
VRNALDKTKAAQQNPGHLLSQEADNSLDLVRMFDMHNQT